MPIDRTSLACRGGLDSLHAGTVASSTTSHLAEGKATPEQIDAAAAGAAGSLGAGWAELRDALARFLPDGTICLDRQLSCLQQQADRVELHFADGMSVQAKVVIGADGCFSKVRQKTVADGPPEFTVSQSAQHALLSCSLRNSNK